MASLRKRVSNWMLRNGEVSDTSAAESSMDVNRGSLDSGYHSMAASGKQDCIPTNEENTPNSSPRGLHKALSTTFHYLSETVRSGATYMYGESSTREGEDSALARSELETQTPRRRLKHRSSIFSSMRRRKNLPASPTEDVPKDSFDTTPTRRILPEKVANLDDTEIPEPGLQGEQNVAPGVAAPMTDKKSLASKQLWPSPVKVAFTDFSKRQTSDQDAISPPSEDPYTYKPDSLPNPASSVNDLPFISSALAMSDPGKGYLSDDRGYYAEAESDQSDSESSKASLKESPAALPQSPYPSMPDVTCTYGARDFPATQGSAPPAYCETDDASLPEFSPGEDSSEIGSPHMGLRSVWEQKWAARREKYLSLGHFETTDSLSNDGFASSLQMKMSPKDTVLEQIVRQIPQTSTGIRLAVEAIESKSGLEYDADESATESYPSNVDVSKATDTSDTSLQSSSTPVNRDDPVASILETQPNSEQFEKQGPQLRNPSPPAASEKRGALQSESDEINPALDPNAAPSNAVFESPRLVAAFQHSRTSSGSNDITGKDCAFVKQSPRSRLSVYDSLRFYSPPAVAYSQRLEALDGQEDEEMPFFKPRKHAYEGQNVASPRPEGHSQDLHADREDIYGQPSNAAALPEATPTIEPSQTSPGPKLVVCERPVCCSPDMGVVLARIDGQPLTLPLRPKTTPTRQCTPVRKVFQDSRECQKSNYQQQVDAGLDVLVTHAQIDEQPFPAAYHSFGPKITPTRKRTPMSELSDNVRSVSNHSIPDAKSRISIAQFSPDSDARTEYAGHELDVVHPFEDDILETSATNRDKRLSSNELHFKLRSKSQKLENSPTSSAKGRVCFAPKTEIISPNASPGAGKSKETKFALITEITKASVSPVVKKSKKAKKKKMQRESEAKQEPALRRFADSLKAAGVESGALESLDARNAEKTTRVSVPEMDRDVDETNGAMTSKEIEELEAKINALDLGEIGRLEETRTLEHEARPGLSMQEEDLAVGDDDIVCAGDCEVWSNCKDCWKHVDREKAVGDDDIVCAGDCEAWVNCKDCWKHVDWE